MYFALMSAYQAGVDSTVVRYKFVLVEFVFVWGFGDGDNVVLLRDVDLVGGFASPGALHSL